MASEGCSAKAARQAPNAAAVRPRASSTGASQAAKAYLGPAPFRPRSPISIASATAPLARRLSASASASPADCKCCRAGRLIRFRLFPAVLRRLNGRAQGSLIAVVGELAVEPGQLPDELCSLGRTELLAEDRFGEWLAELGQEAAQIAVGVVNDFKS